MSTHPTAEEIAKEAASELVYRIQEPDAWKRFDPMQREELTTIILTAARRIAAQMVRDSGAVEALKLARLHTPSEEDYIIDAALAKLRAITANGEKV